VKIKSLSFYKISKSLKVFTMHHELCMKYKEISNQLKIDKRKIQKLVSIGKKIRESFNKHNR